jgi:hypothetical protein
MVLTVRLADHYWSRLGPPCGSKCLETRRDGLNKKPYVRQAQKLDTGHHATMHLLLNDTCVSFVASSLKGRRLVSGMITSNYVCMNICSLYVGKLCVPVCPCVLPFNNCFNLLD